MMIIHPEYLASACAVISARLRRKTAAVTARPAMRYRSLARCHVVAMLAAGLLFNAGLANAESDDQTAIAKLLHGTFDRPDAQLTIAPIVVAGGYAIAGWTQGDMGGRALLRKKVQQWSLILCAGDEIKSAHALMTAGISSPAAAALERDLSAAESAMPKQQTAMFSRFQGIAMMDGTGDHVHHDNDASN
jgi:hypothetical protein